MIITPPPVDAGPPHQDQPPAHPAADQTARRIGGRRRGGVRGVESGVPGDGGGRVIPHAAPGAIGALMVSVIEAPFPTALMAGLGGLHRAPAGQGPATHRAVGVATVARRTDREEAVAPAAGLLAEGAEGLVHGVGVRAATSDWTVSPNRGTTEATGSVCRSSRRSRGSGGTRALTSSASHPYAIRKTGSTPRQGLWTLPQVRTHTTRPHLRAKPPGGRFRTSAHSPSSSC